jgi:hypothetical protein
MSGKNEEREMNGGVSKDSARSLSKVPTDVGGVASMKFQTPLFL